MRCYIAYFHSTLLIKVVLTSNGTGNGTHGIQKQVELQDVQFTGHYLGGDFDEIAYDKSKAQHIINHEDIMLKTYSKIISTYTSLFEQYDCSLKVRLFGLIFLPRGVLTVVCRFVLVMRVMYVVKFRETAKKYK